MYNLRKYFSAFSRYLFQKKCLSLRQTVGGDSHTSRTSSGISKMRHFTINLVMNIIGAILFLVMGIALIIGFALNQSIVEELQQVTLLVLILVIHILNKITG